MCWLLAPLRFLSPIHRIRNANRLYVVESRKYDHGDIDILRLDDFINSMLLHPAPRDHHTLDSSSSVNFKINELIINDISYPESLCTGPIVIAIATMTVG